MKIKMFFLLISFCSLFACSNETLITEPMRDTSYVVRFQLDFRPDLEPFSYTKSIPPDYPSEPTVSKSGGDDQEKEKISFQFIEYALYDAKEDTLIHHIRYSKNDGLTDDFGVFIYDTLRAGSYKACILTHSVSNVTSTDNILTFPTVSDSFYGNEQVEIGIGTMDQEKEILLKRMVSRIEFVATDPVPDKVKTFHLSSLKQYNKIDVFSGKTLDESVAYVSNHTFTSAERGDDIFNTHAFFTLVPPGNDIKLPEILLVAKDDTDKEVRKRTVTNIPIVANKITRYKGILYTPGSIDDRFDLTFENNGEWDEPIEEDLPDE